MHSHPHIHYLRRQDIDDARWDECIQTSPNGLIYGKTFFLDTMTDGQWDALVWEDYQTVMPLTWRRKWGIRYLYQPAFMQQLGIFSIAPIPSHLTDAFLKVAARHYKFAEIFLNYENALPGLKPFTNLVLDLRSSYRQLATGYGQDLVNNLKKAGHSSFQYTEDPPLLHTLSFFQQEYSHRLPHVSPADYARFETVCHLLQKKGQLLLRCIRTGSGSLLATALLPRDNSRLYLLQSTVSAAGRKAAANHFLLDRLIREFAERPLMLDFEGSEQPGIAHFYRNFGAKDQPYYFYRNNSLSWPLRHLKQ